MKSRPLGRKGVVVGDEVKVVGDTSGDEGALARIVEVDERRTVLRRTADDTDMFNGSPDRYEWKLLGKKEIFVPANSYRLHSDQLKYADIIKKAHLNQDHTRYEKRRVWVVDSFVKKGVNHLYKRRTFYVDEDSWQIVAVDVYDQRDQLWRVQEGHHVIAYDKPYQLPALETVYDLQSARYLVMAANNEDDETVTRAFTVGDFDPTNVSKLATK